MTFNELIDQIKKIPLEELRKEFDGYFECVLEAQCLEVLGSVMCGYFGEPFKPAGKKPSKEASDFAKAYGGIETQQTLYYVERQGLSSCGMIWPWNNGQRVTVKLAYGKIA